MLQYELVKWLIEIQGFIFWMSIYLKKLKTPIVSYTYQQAQFLVRKLSYTYSKLSNVRYFAVIGQKVFEKLIA